MKILIDNGHGINAFTNGKYSPNISSWDIKDPTIYDNRFREGNFNRIIAKKVYNILKAKGYDVELICPEDADISLGTRVRRVNDICNKVGSKNCLFISIHSNANGYGEKFGTASGFSVFVARKCSANSKKLAKIFQLNSEKLNLKGNRSIPGERYWSADFYVLTKTNCPAVLTENLFYDNEKDLKFLLTDKGKDTIVDLHIKSIEEYIKNNK